jgi:hypothetical protein
MTRMAYGRPIGDYLVEEALVVVSPRNGGKLDPLELIRETLLRCGFHHLRMERGEGGKRAEAN